MKRTIITTSDGSSSISMDDWGETYHSIHGAVQEAMHVYIQNGYERIQQDHLVVLEMGFGTGLNTYLTYLQAVKNMQTIEYHSVEAFPLNEEEVRSLNYLQLSSNEIDQHVFTSLHQCEWEELIQVHSQFALKKLNTTFEKLSVDCKYYDVVYFDAFGYQFQPELWSEAIFSKMFAALKEGGVLVTYACRGPIKRAMKSVGFELEFVPGPPGKREMTIAHKPMASNGVLNSK